MALSRRHPGAAPPSYPDPASSQVPTCPFPSAPGRVPALPARGTLGARRRQRRPQPQGGRCSPRQPSALPEGALTEVPAPLRRGLVGENPGGIGGVEGGAGGVGMLPAEEFAEGALHRLVFSHAAAGRAGAGEGPVRPRPALARMTEPRTGSPGASTRSCPPPSSAPAHRKTGAKGAAARLEMRATWAGKRLRLGRGPAPRPPPRLPPRRPTPPAAFLPASFYNGPLSARPRWAGDLAQPTPSRGDKPSLPQVGSWPSSCNLLSPGGRRRASPLPLQRFRSGAGQYGTFGNHSCAQHRGLGWSKLTRGRVLWALRSGGCGPPVDIWKCP